MSHALTGQFQDFKARYSDAEFVDWHALADVVLTQLAELSSPAKVVAVSGSQGSGKSTLAAILGASLPHAAPVSIDDFYLTKAQRQHLAESVHPLLATRGVPGTHDTAWLQEVLAAVRCGQLRQVPHFDKGADDRAGQHDFADEVMILEGWCVGVTPQASADLDDPVNRLEAEQDTERVWRTWVNQQIVQDYLPLWQEVDFWIHLKAPGFAQVLEWRSQQEAGLPEAQRMSADALEQFVMHYERLTRHMWLSPLAGPGIAVTLDSSHQVMALETV